MDNTKVAACGRYAKTAPVAELTTAGTKEIERENQGYPGFTSICEECVKPRFPKLVNQIVGNADSGNFPRM